MLADHRRAPDGARQRVIDVEHFAPLFPTKPRARVMLYREALLGLGGVAMDFLTHLSRRHRAHLGPQVLAIHALYQDVGAADLLAAMARASQAGCHSAEALHHLLTQPAPPALVPRLALPGVPSQAEIDRPLSAYEACVTIDVALPATASQGLAR